jgi:hypothetical protein
LYIFILVVYLDNDQICVEHWSLCKSSFIRKSCFPTQGLLVLSLLSYIVGQKENSEKIRSRKRGGVGVVMLPALMSMIHEVVCRIAFWCLKSFLLFLFLFGGLSFPYIKELISFCVHNILVKLTCIYHKSYGVKHMNSFN